MKWKICVFHSSYIVHRITRSFHEAIFFFPHSALLPVWIPTLRAPNPYMLRAKSVEAKKFNTLGPILPILDNISQNLADASRLPWIRHDFESRFMDVQRVVA